MKEIQRTFGNKTQTKDTLFSVIIPCFNCAHFVEDAIASVLGQTYSNLEIIAIDDGSSDGTIDILNRFEKEDSRVRVLRKNNGGYSTAVNLGLNNIQGDYFLTMGSDDLLRPDLLENVHRVIGRDGPDMIVFKVRRHWVDEQKADEIDPATRFEKTLSFSGLYADFYEAYRYEAGYFGLRDTGKIFRHEVLGKLRYFGHYGFDADGIFSLLFAHKSRSFFVIPKEGFVWNLHKDSLSGRSLSVETQVDRLGNWTNLVKELKKLPKRELAGIDYLYSTIGTSILPYLAKNAFKTFVKNYSLVYSYCFHLRTFWLRKRRFMGFGKRALLNSYFPMIVAIARKTTHAFAIIASKDGFDIKE